MNNGVGICMKRKIEIHFTKPIQNEVEPVDSSVFHLCDQQLFLPLLAHHEPTMS
jgi:hypothetical protein